MLDHSLDFLLLPVSEYRLPHELLPSAWLVALPKLTRYSYLKSS